MASVQVNGTPRSVRDGATLLELLEELGLDPRWVVAELNGVPLGRDRFAESVLSDGDRLELVRPVAGG